MNENIADTGPLNERQRLTEGAIRLKLEKRIAELTRENEQFAYIVSHDLQAPLRSITGFLELIERRYADKLDDAGKQYIGFALKGSQKLKGLVLDLLEFSRLNTTEFLFEQVSLMDVLKEVTEELDQRVQAAAVKVEYRDLPVVEGVRTLLCTLFSQLIDNSIKFRSVETPRITIWSEQHSGYHLIHIIDNGIGIDPAFLEKVFVIFRKLNADEKKFPGNGKGLAICKKIAALHGWEIAAFPATGTGTRITIKIKFA